MSGLMWLSCWWLSVTLNMWRSPLSCQPFSYWNTGQSNGSTLHLPLALDEVNCQMFILVDFDLQLDFAKREPTKCTTISGGALSKTLYFQGTLCCSCSQFLSLVHCLVFWDTVLGAACWEYSSSQKAMRIIQTCPINWNRFFHSSARGYSVSRYLYCFSYYGLTLDGHWTLGAHKSCSVTPPHHMDRGEKYKACGSK